MSHDRPEPDWLLVVAQGRTGSTLLQGMLNSTPGYLIRGENGGFVQAALGSLAYLTSAHRQFADGAGVPTSSWYGADSLDPAGYRDAIYRAIVEQLAGTEDSYRVLGFKEIRWHMGPPKERESRCALLDDLFPGVRFILHDRDPEEVRRSGWWATMPDQQFAAQRDSASAFRDQLEEMYADRCFRTDYSDLASRDRGRLADLAGWLGEPADVVEEWTRVLDIRHGW